MRSAVYIVPGRLDARTGGSIYNRRMVEALGSQGWSIDVRELNDDFPVPSAASLTQAAAVLRDIPTGTIVVVDGLVFGAIPEVVRAEGARLVLVPVVHMPLASEAGLDPTVARARAESERIALSAATVAIATGQSTIDALIASGISETRIALVMPGTDRCDVSRGSGCGDAHLLCVAALTAGKGHDILLRALAANRRHMWHLTCAGSVDRQRETAVSVQTLARALDLADRVTFAGELGQVALNRLFDRTDLFVLATLRETFGMAVAEALAHGIPVVSTTTGEIPRLVGADAGILVAPGDVDGLVAALSSVLENASFRTKLHSGARAARARLAGWGEAAGRMAAVLECASNA